MPRRLVLDPALSQSTLMSERPLPGDILERFSTKQIARLEGYFAALLETNRKFNLTAIRNEDEAWQRHIVESLTLLPVVDECCTPAEPSSGQARRLLDVGSGGGLPGMVFAIARPDLEVTLLESIEKKARFLQETAEKLELTNVRVVCERAESLATPTNPERAAYDLVTARAVAALPTLLELTIPFCRVGGHLLAIKGERAAEELRDARQALGYLGTELRSQHRTPTATVLLLRKMRPTDERFPRRVGEPKRRPL